VDSIQLRLDMHGPADTPVGPVVRVWVSDEKLFEGAADPDGLDALVAAIETVTDKLVEARFINDESPLDVHREGWASRWLEGATVRLRRAIQADLEQAVDRLTDRRGQLRRLK
jgi:hypothetical protein